MQKNTVLLVVVLLILTHFSFSQKIDSTNKLSHLSCSVTVANNGISLIPDFSFGKPAVIFNMSVGRGKLGFGPEMRFALEKKPCSFLFWWRYKLLTAKRLNL